MAGAERTEALEAPATGASGAVPAGPPEPPAAPGRPGWKFWLRIGISLVLLAVLLTKAPKNLDDVVPRTDHLRTAVLLGAALVTTLIGIVLSAWRWQRVLAVFDAHVPLRTLTSHYLAGQFMGNVLPSTIGGDVLRVSRVSNTVGSSTTGFASVVLERLSGFVALPLLVFLGLIWRPSLLDHDRAWMALLIASITLALLVAILVAAGHPRIAGRFTDNANWTRFIGAVHQGIDQLRAHPRRAVGVLLAAVAYQVSVVISVALIFEALQLDVPVAAAFAFVPAVAMVQVLPLSFNGLGVREGMLVLFLHPLGVGKTQAIAAGLLWGAAMLAVSALGAPAFAVGHRERTEDVTSPS
jgi:hypothetical protein